MIDIAEARASCEEALVGICLVDPSAMVELATTVSYLHFIDRDLGDIFRVVSEMADARKAVDVNAVLVELSQRGLIKRIGGPAAIARIVDKSYSPAMGRYYSDQLKKIHRKDTVRAAAAKLADSLADPMADVAEAIAKFEILEPEAALRTQRTALRPQW